MNADSNDPSLMEELLIRAARAEAESPGVLASETAGPREQPGATIGRFKLLQEIGEGGFGTVWMAEQQEPVKRRVALKIIKLGMDTHKVVARFEAERQALALMDHPNIAKVLDGGATESGRPYFAMELVKGVPITDYCDTEDLGTRERLELFVAVCQAIQHAHQKGIIHRDIKPNNVLVTLHDGVPVPKVIDFGIAKATNAELTEKTLFTEFRQFIGTPEYMSPEQAEMSGLDIDSRSDIYALGVLLYELLTGTTPLEPEKLRRAGLGEMQRLIRSEEPPKPSTRVSAWQEGDPRSARSPSAAAHHRRHDARSITRQLRGDVDWIVMKALEKDRTRRYDTATSLARDIERHLRDEAIEAVPPSRVYRLRKFVRRNRVGVLTGGLVAAALLVGFTLSTLGFMRARDEADATRAVADFYEQMFTSLVPYQVASANPADRATPGPVGFTDLTVADFLERAEGSIASTFHARPALEASVRRTFGWTFAGLGRGDEALRQLGRALEAHRASLGPTDVETLRTESMLSFAHFLRGHPKAAAETLRSTPATYSRQLGPDHPLTLSALRFLAHMLWSAGELESAEELARDAVERASRTLGEGHGTTLWARHTLAVVALSRGRLDEADAMLREVEAGANRVLSNNPLAALAPAMRAIVLCELGQLDEAESRLAAAIESTVRRFGAGHPFLSHAHTTAALIRARRGDPDGAVEALRELEETQSERIGSDHFLRTSTEAELIDLLIETGRFEEAEERARRLPDAERIASGPNGTCHLRARSQLGRALEGQGRSEEAAEVLRSVVEDAERLLPGGFLELPGIRSSYGDCLAALGQYDDAEVQLLEAHESMERMRGGEHAQVRASAARLAALYVEWGKPEEAAAWRSR